MWAQFYITAALCAVALYLPGYALLRGLNVARISSVVFAPIVDVVLFSLLAAAYGKLGLSGSWATIALPVLVFGVAVCAVRISLGRKRVSSRAKRSRPDERPSFLGRPFRIIEMRSDDASAPSALTARRWFQPACLGLYAVIGVAVSTMAFGSFLGSPDSFVQEYDNLHHLGTTYLYLDGGNWSSFNNSVYRYPDELVYDPFGYSAYYPSAWNCIAAMAAQISGASATVANNAVNFATAAVVLPASLFGFMCAVFYRHPSVVPFGAFVCLAFGAFPWAMMVFGPLYPNMLAFSLLPVIMAAFVAMFTRKNGAHEHVIAAALFCTGVISCAFTQPNAVFSAAVLLIPYCVDRVGQLVDMKFGSSARRRMLRLASQAAFIVFVVCLWLVLYNLPFLKSVVSYQWPPFRDVSEAANDVLTLSFRMDSPQFLLAFAVFGGAAITLWRRRYLWLTFSWILAGAIYIVDTACDGPLKQIVSGFWYSDSLRVAAFAAVAAMPLAALGLWGATRLIVMGAGKKWPVQRDCARSEGTFVSILVALVFAFVVFRPDAVLTRPLMDEGGFSHAVSNLRGMFDPSRDNVYDPDERDFVQKVKEAIPGDAVVINVPDDGSAFAYPADGLNVMYRYLTGYGGNDEIASSKFIRDGLANITRSHGVLEAVRDTGAEYVLLLDQGTDSCSPRERRYLFSFEGGWDWQGILSITDETPGFEVVLAQDDMRLYRITAID